MTNQFVSNCSKRQNCQVQKFVDYFKDNYAHRPEEWAIGLRDIFVDTNNMALESFHKILKHNAKFMDGHHNRCFDTLIKHLFGYMANMIKHDLITSSCNSVTDKHTATNFKNHMKALAQSVSIVSVTEKGYRVVSFTRPGVSYEVIRISTICPHKNKCYCTCKQYNVCHHLYSCTCPTAVDAHNRYFFM